MARETRVPIVPQPTELSSEDLVANFAFLEEEKCLYSIWLSLVGSSLYRQETSIFFQYRPFQKQNIKAKNENCQMYFLENPFSVRELFFSLDLSRLYHYGLSKAALLETVRILWVSISNTFFPPSLTTAGCSPTLNIPFRKQPNIQLPQIYGGKMTFSRTFENVKNEHGFAITFHSRHLNL